MGGTCSRKKKGEKEQFEPQTVELYPADKLAGPPVQQRMAQVTVKCPVNAEPGTQIQILALDGTPIKVKVPAGVSPGGLFQVKYPVSASAAPSPDESSTLDLLLTRATGLSSDDWIKNAGESIVKCTENWRDALSSQVDGALKKSDNSEINRLLDSALASSILGGSMTPEPIRRAATDSARRQLKEAIECEDPKQLKGALVAATRLQATSLQEFTLATEKYKELKKLPSGWDVTKMALNREGDKIVAKTLITDPAVHAKFQRLLDLTHRKVYTRDRLGQPVPKKLKLVRVLRVENADIWSEYTAKREVIRRELEADPSDFKHFRIDTAARPKKDKIEGKTADVGDSAEAIATFMANESGDALHAEVNECFLFHGTTSAAADSIATTDFRVNLAGVNAGTLYGRGLYFAENASKSDEYCRPSPTGERFMLLCRVVLGRAYYTDELEPNPRDCEDAVVKGRSHSVLGDRKKCRGTFREFVIFDEEQVYPNYILTYQRVEPGSDPDMRQMQVQCPEGAQPGSVIQVMTPENQLEHVLVPAGISVGQTFIVQY